MEITNFTEEITYQWQKKWSTEDLQLAIKNCEKDPVCLPYFLKYLPKDGFVLESGCGLGQWVIYLSRLGYQMIGVEIVPDCVERCKKYFPEMDIRVGDVRNLLFPDQYFNGYISIGVIEHMIEGPESTLKEMQRVLKPGGVAILTVPSFNYFLRTWYPFRELLVKIFRYNRLIRKILGKPCFPYDKHKNQTKLKEIKKQLHPDFWPIIGIDPIKGPIFIEYKYRRNQLENFLKLFNFEIIESVSILHSLVFRDTFGKIFLRKNCLTTEEDNIQLNRIGRTINWILYKLGPHFFNYVYLYVIKAKK